MAELRLQLLDVSVRVQMDDARALQAIAACFDCRWRGNASSVEIAVPLQSGECPGRFRWAGGPGNARDIGVCDLYGVIGAILSEVARASREFVVFHAAAVSRGGKVVLLVGGTHSGKSTLTAELVTRGFHLFSDEATALSRVDGLIHRFPRLVFLRARSPSSLGETSAGSGAEAGTGGRYGPSKFGGRWARPSGRVRLIVSPHFQEAAPFFVRELSSADALTRLEQGRVSQWCRASFEVGSSWARTAQRYYVRYTDCGMAAEFIQRAVDLPIGGRLGGV
ncbi:MAG: hypothetical protein IPK72_21740 [Candidatus Eisenbacteria bacterium]|nr:hypothetical protein [Candidatus Eisenbacteria bacterium]